MTPVTDLLENPDALLNSSHLRELGLNRRGIDAVLRNCPTIHLPGYSRAMVRVKDYRHFVDASTHEGDRVR
jgi:hypothetical protein